MRHSKVHSRSTDGESGAVFVEAALSISVLLFLLFAGFDLLRVSSMLNAGQTAVIEAARWAGYGESLPGTSDRTASLKRQVVLTAARYGLPSDISRVQICPASDIECNSESTLELGELFVIRLKVPVQFMMLGGYSREVEFEAFGQVEPI